PGAEQAGQYSLAVQHEVRQKRDEEDAELRVADRAEKSLPEDGAGGSGGRSSGEKVGRSLSRLEQGSDAEICEIARANQLEREEHVAGGAEQCRQPHRRRGHPGDEGECDATRRQQDAPASMRERVLRHHRHIRPGRHREQQRDAGEHEELGVDHAGSGSSNDISYTPPTSFAWWIQPILRRRSSISRFSGRPLSEKVLMACTRPTRASSASKALPRPRRWNSSITATATSATSVPRARS